MLWIRLSDKTVDAAAKLFPHVSFPESGPDEACMAALGCAPIVEPDYDAETQKLVPSAPHQSAGGWSIRSAVPWTAEDISTRTIVRLQELRSERNRRLRESDWTQMPDSPLSPETRAGWAAYRQALRDITIGYSGAPLQSVQWPIRPE